LALVASASSANIGSVYCGLYSTETKGNFIMTINWNDVEPESKSRRDSTVTKAVIEGALARSDLSGSKIATALRAGGMNCKDAYAGVVCNIARATVDVLVSFGEVRINGKTYVLSPVQPKPELVKKPA
jgi:hypothetical protein